MGGEAAVDPHGVGRAQTTEAVLHDLKDLGRRLNYHGRGVAGRPQVLCTLYEAGGAKPQRELGESFGLTASSLSEVLSKLEAQGLVERTRERDDNRKLRVALTERGIAEAEVEVGRRDRFREWSLAVLDDEEQERLRYLLDKVLDHWRQGDWGTVDD